MGDEGGLTARVLGGTDAEANETDAATALDPIAAAMLVDRSRRSRSADPSLAAYLARHESLLAIQAEHLEEQGGLQLAHLRVRRWKDLLTLTLQAAIAGVVMLAIATLGSVAWKAYDDHSVVIAGFTAPPDFAARGITGDVVAGDLLGKLSSIVSFVGAHSFSSTGAVTTDTSADVKVEIPETGVSFSEAGRLLRDWLGSARKVSGSLREDSGGLVTLTARMDGGQVFSATGAASDLSALEQNVAEQVYGYTDPNNLPIYLIAHGRKAEAFAAASRYVSTAVAREDRANSITMLGDLSDDPYQQSRFGRMALSIDPGLRAARFNLVEGALALEHPQEALEQSRAMLSLDPADQPPQHRGAGASQMLGYARSTADALLGDYAGAARDRVDYHPKAWELSELDLDEAVYSAMRHDRRASMNLIAQAEVLGGVAPLQDHLARYWSAIAGEDWRGAVEEAQALVALDAAASTNSGDADGAAGAKVRLERSDRPLLAVAEARAGNLEAASTLINSTSTDCYLCLRSRGQIAAAARKADDAKAWFAAAIRLAPGLPQAYVDLGVVSLASGDLNKALSAAAAANQRGPHYADALKLWGDALAKQQRWADSVDKYDRAVAEAPAWQAVRTARSYGQHRAQ